MRRINTNRNINKKAQIGGADIMVFIAVVVGILLLAPIMLKIINTVIPQLGNSVANSSVGGGVVANQTVSTLTTKFTGMWDTVILVAFIANILILLVASFLIDVHPAFLIFYIITAVMALIFAPTYLSVASNIYADSTNFGTEAAQLPMAGFIANNFGVILLGVFILSGIIMFAKFKLGSGR